MAIMVSESEKRDINRGVIKVPVALIGVFIFMSAQTFGAIWWASSITTKMDYLLRDQLSLKDMVEQNTKDRYTSTQAGKDKIEYEKDDLIINRRIDRIETKVDALNTKVIEFQSKYNQNYGNKI